MSGHERNPNGRPARVHLRRAGALFAAALLASMLGGTGAQAQGEGLLVGWGTGSGPNCPPQSDTVGIEGGTTDGTSWVFTAQLNRTGTPPGNPPCATAGTSAFSGTWNPLLGGCLSGIGGASLCIDKVPTTGMHTNVAVMICLGGPGCSTGTATVLRL